MYTTPHYAELKRYVGRKNFQNEGDIYPRYDKINALGIPVYNYLIMVNCTRKIIIFTIIAIIIVTIQVFNTLSDPFKLFAKPNI